MGYLLHYVTARVDINQHTSALYYRDIWGAVPEIH
jgi:hypothetical protein